MADLVERILARERPFIDSLIVHSVEKNRKFNCAIVVPAHFSNLPIVKMPLCTFVFRISSIIGLQSKRCKEKKKLIHGAGNSGRALLIVNLVIYRPSRQICHL